MSETDEFFGRKGTIVDRIVDFPVCFRIAGTDQKDADMLRNATANILPRAERTRPLALVVNDTQEILDLFRDILSEEGFDVVLHSYAPKELETVLEIDPNVVILDFLIGDEAQGWQFLQKMKMHRQTENIPCVVCTGAVNLVKELEGHLAIKNVGIVIKPFDIDDLMATLRMTMGSELTISPNGNGGDPS